MWSARGIVRSPYYSWPVLIHLQSTWFIRSKDKLVCGASVQWGILLFNSSLLPPSFSPFSASPPPFLPLYVYSHLHCTWQQPVVFTGEEKNKTALVKISLSQTKFPLSEAPWRGVRMEGAKAFSFCRKAVEQQGEPYSSKTKGEPKRQLVKTVRQWYKPHSL